MSTLTENRESGAVDRPDDSFDAYVHATGQSMHRLAVLLCGDHHLAEDLTQTAYAKIFVNWHRVSSANNPVGYGRTVLTRTFLSHRRLRRSSERPSDTLPERSANDADHTTKLDLLAALGHLKHEDRVVLVLRYWEDLSVAQTARELRVSDANVRQRTHRAITRLRALMPEIAEGDLS